MVSSISLALTASPQFFTISTTFRPWLLAIWPQRSPNLPALTVMTVSPGLKRLYTAAVMAPLPEQARGMTGSVVPKRSFSFSSTLFMILWKSDLR